MDSLELKNVIDDFLGLTSELKHLKNRDHEANLNYVSPTGILLFVIHLSYSEYEESWRVGGMNNTLSNVYWNSLVQIHRS